MNIIGCLDKANSGSYHIEGTDVSDLSDNQLSDLRNQKIGFVFQNFNLMPKLTACQNVELPLTYMKVPKKERRERALEMLRLVGLEDRSEFKPMELSGGQKQRVAIARAVVLEPRLLLLDEPLGALDLQLRRQMQLELKNLQRSLGIAFIYVTHDQEEALNMSDRIVIMNQGKICQMGTPEEIYEHPVSIFSAQFIGQTNLLPGVVSARLPDNKVSIEMNGLDIPAVAYHALPEIGDKVCLSIRMERILYSTTPPAGFHLSATVKEKQFSGGSQRTTLALADGHELVSSLPTHDGVKVHVGDQVHLWWGLRHGAIVPQEDAQ